MKPTHPGQQAPGALDDTSTVQLATPAAATGPADGAGELEPPEQKRTLAVLVIAQVFSGAGLAAGITVGALLAQDMLDATSLAGLPSALFTIGSAAAAVTVGRLSHRAGRRAGLALPGHGHDPRPA